MSRSFQEWQNRFNDLYAVRSTIHELMDTVDGLREPAFCEQSDELDNILRDIDYLSTSIDALLGKSVPGWGGVTITENDVPEPTKPTANVRYNESDTHE